MGNAENTHMGPRLDDIFDKIAVGKFLELCQQRDAEAVREALEEEP